MDRHTSFLKGGVSPLNVCCPEVNHRVLASLDGPRIRIQVDPNAATIEKRHVRIVLQKLKIELVAIKRSRTFDVLYRNGYLIHVSIRWPSLTRFLSKESPESC